MVCKEDVVSWFKELESYKRIDAMCTLLNMCLPFELRFIGTYLEELGKRDFQELRGAELRANSPPELAADIADVGDPRTRRKMALYVSLLRSCNSVCAASLYRAMLGMERARLLRRLPPDLLEEVLLLYTMALHHPAFTFHQKSHFGEVLDELQREEEPPPAAAPAPTPLPGPPPPVPLPHNMSVPPPSLPPPGLMFMKPPGLQGEPRGELGSPSTGAPVVALLGGEYPPPPPEYLAPPWLVPPLVQPPMEAPLTAFPAPGSPGGGGGAGEVSPPPPPAPASPPRSLAALAANFEVLTTADRGLREAFHKLNGVRRSPSDSGGSAPPSPPHTPHTAPPPPPTRGPPALRHYLPPPAPAPAPPPGMFARGFGFCRGVNGDGWAGFVPVVFAPPKLSCWNCGAGGHAGSDCPEPSMEEVTRANHYRLDFAPPPPAPPPNTPPQPPHPPHPPDNTHPPPTDHDR